MALDPTEKLELFVRALFDFDPSHEIFLPKKGLAFKCGDVLHVTNASDDEWWQARHIASDGHDDQVQGIIPSAKRVEKKERTKRRHINFSSHHKARRARSKSPARSANSAHGPKSPMVLLRKFPFVKRHTDNKLNTADVNGHLLDRVQTYQEVEQKIIDYHRPVVLLGPLKDRLRDELLAKDTDRFERCTNPTDFQAIGRIAKSSSKHCIVDPIIENTVSDLTHNDLYPVTIFIKASGTEQLREWNKRWSQDYAQKQYHEFEKLRLSSAHFISATIEGDTPEEIFDKVRTVIERLAAETLVWVPSDKTD